MYIIIYIIIYTIIYTIIYIMIIYNIIDIIDITIYIINSVDYYYLYN